MRKVNLEITGDEALVLFEFLSRFSDKEELKLSHGSEERALWNLLASLEKELEQPLSADYDSLLKIARERLSSD